MLLTETDRLQLRSFHREDAADSRECMCNVRYEKKGYATEACRELLW